MILASTQQRAEHSGGLSRSRLERAAAATIGYPTSSRPTLELPLPVSHSSGGLLP